MKVFQKIKQKIWGLPGSSAGFAEYLRSRGCKIGKGTYFFDARNIHVDIDNAAFIQIGEYCKIATGVHILAHDYSYSVLRRVYDDIPKKAAITRVGNNCFIGVNSIILMGAEIGDNVIIGAGSVVSGKIPDNQVWGGNPAKFICTLEEYHKKCADGFEKNAKLYLNVFLKQYGRLPSVQELQYYSLLFLNNDKNAEAEYMKMSFNGDERSEVIRTCMRYKSKYENYEDFVQKNIS